MIALSTPKIIHLALSLSHYEFLCSADELSQEYARAVESYRGGYE